MNQINARVPLLHIPNRGDQVTAAVKGLIGYATVGAVQAFVVKPKFVNPALVAIACFTHALVGSLFGPTLNFVQHSYTAFAGKVKFIAARPNLDAFAGRVFRNMLHFLITGVALHAIGAITLGHPLVCLTIAVGIATAPILIHMRTTKFCLR